MQSKMVQRFQQQKSFQMDIKDFYPSITKETLDPAIVFA